MKPNFYISRKEHILLTLFVFIAFGFVLSVFTLQVAQIYNHTVYEQQQELRTQANSNTDFSFAFYPFHRVIGGFHFLTFFIFIAMLTTKRYFLSSFLTLLYAIFFIYGLTFRYFGSWSSSQEFSPNVSFLKTLYGEANSFDYIAALFISILLFLSNLDSFAYAYKKFAKEN